MASSVDIVMLMLDALCKSLVLLALALAAILLLRRVVWKATNVHNEHLVWFSLALAMLALPALSFWLPGIPIPVASLAVGQEASGGGVSLAAVAEEPEHGSLDLAGSYTADAPLPLSLGSGVPQTSLQEHGESLSQAKSDSQVSTLLPTATIVEAPAVAQVAAASNAAGFRAGWPEIAIGIWLLGLTCLGLRFLFAYWAIRRLLRRRRAITLPDEAVRGIPARTSVCTSQRVDAPIVVGWFRHFVLLPASWETWSKEKLAAVLAHEFSHIDRRDGLTRLIAELNAMIHWFNPVAWIARRQMSGLAEMACDEAAVVSIGCETQYARYLLEIAALRHSRSSALAVAMASSETGKRIERLLDASRPFAARSSKLFVVFLLLISAPVVLAVAMTRPTPLDDKSEQPVELADHEWYAEVDGNSLLRFQLRVLNPDGTLAKDASVRARSRDPMKVTNRGDYFELEHEFGEGYQPGVRAVATSADAKLVGAVRNGPDEMGYDAKHGLTIQLRPARVVSVKVVDDGQPIANAHVGIDCIGGFEMFARTNSSGVAEFQLNSGAQLSQIGTYTDDGRVGGYQLMKKPVRDANASTFEVELSSTSPRTIRIVDQDNQPIAGLGFEVNIADPRDYNYIPLFERSKLVTDENGEVKCESYPDWREIHTYVDKFSDPTWSKIGKERFEDGQLVVRLGRSPKLQRVRVRGKVNMPEGLRHSFYVKLASHQHPEKGRYDAVACRTDDLGNFSADVMPGATYSASVNDAEWMSEAWVGIPVDAETKETKAIEIDVFPGEPVEVIATAGPEKRPIPGLSVSLQQRSASFTWEEDGEERNGSVSRQWWRQTDAQGRFRTLARPGEIEAWVSASEWRPRVKSIVSKGAVTELRFHRATAGRRMVYGRIFAPKADFALGGYEIRLLPMDGASRDEAKAITDAQGRFQAEISAATVGAVLRTPDGKWFGSTISDHPESGIDLPLYATTEYEGRYLDAAGRPLADKWIKLFPRFENRILKEARPYDYFGEELDPIKAITDAEGKFTLQGVPYDIKMTLRAQKPDIDPSVNSIDARSDDSNYLGERYLVRGEKRPPEVIQLRDKSSAKEMLLQEFFVGRLRDCKLMRTRMLLIVSNHDERSLELVRKLFYDTDRHPRLLDYLVLWAGAGEDAKPENKAFLKKHNWSLPGEKTVLAVALDAEGAELDRIELQANDASPSPRAVNLINRNALKKLDAIERYDAALAEAKRTRKRVWISISQTRCSPCFAFARWWDRNREKLEEGFVPLKIDDVRESNGAELVKKLIGDKQFGIPYHLIVESDGSLVVSSEGPLGNIGYPSSFEGISHLSTMLRTHSGLTQAEVKAIANDVKSRE